MHLDIDTNMKMIGKRIPYYATFTVSWHILYFPYYLVDLTCFAVVCVFCRLAALKMAFSMVSRRLSTITVGGAITTMHWGWPWTTLIMVSLLMMECCVTVLCCVGHSVLCAQLAGHSQGLQD